jgi:hypothetical protein
MYSKISSPEHRLVLLFSIHGLTDERSNRVAFGERLMAVGKSAIAKEKVRGQAPPDKPRCACGSV